MDARRRAKTGMDELTKKKQARRDQARLRKLQKKNKKLKEDERRNMEEILAIADPGAEGGEGNDMGEPTVEETRAAKKKQKEDQRKAERQSVALEKLAKNLKVARGHVVDVSDGRKRRCRRG